MASTRRDTRRPGRGGTSQSQAPKARGQHRIYQPGKRHMELIPSVSRSSGLDKDGDALRDQKVQEEYREFIQTKVDDYWKAYPLRGPVPGSGEYGPEAARHKKETEENLLILFRKLREGLLSRQRRDAFALEVYETSLHLSVLFKSPVQTTSTLSHLFPNFYMSISNSTRRPPTRPVSSAANGPATQPLENSPPQPPPSALPSTLILLLHHLVSSYPSQLAFYTRLHELHPVLQRLLREPHAAARGPSAGSIPPASPKDRPSGAVDAHAVGENPPTPPSAHDWLTALARCLRRRTYARLDGLTRRAAFRRFAPAPDREQRARCPREDQDQDQDQDQGGDGGRDLALEAIQALVDELVAKARGTTWRALRTAYREVHLRATVAAAGARGSETTAAWLARSLVLRGQGGAGRADGEALDAVEGWLEVRAAKGEARRKEGEGMEGRWILVK
ncbi:hypothetical protein BD413DRAFT_629044 [Trametes elegans]|nr:hypothetical protein BD413DRAFT_629044 [Trametes elegans]